MPPDDAKPLAASFNAVSKTPAEISAAALGRAVAAGGQFTVLGDTNHGDMSMMRFLASEPAMKALKDAGVKHMVLEVRHEYQPLADAVAAGKMTPQTYAQRKFEMARDAGDTGFTGPSQRDVVQAGMIQAAAKYGIKVHCAEKQAAGLKEHGELVDKIDGLLAAQEATTPQAAMDGMSVTEQASHFLRNLAYKASGGTLFPSTPERNHMEMLKPLATGSTPLMQSLATHRQEIIAERVAGDIGIAAVAREKAGNEKTVVFYGAQHGSTACDLDEHLGATRVNLYADKRAALAGFQNTAMMGEQLPQQSIVLATGENITRQQAQGLTLPAPVLAEDKRVNTCAAPKRVN